jgi:hypothetical protein
LRDEQDQAVAESTARRQIGELADVAASSAFLVSDTARRIAGGPFLIALSHVHSDVGV